MFQDRILFIDGEAIVIDKPAGLPVDRPRDRSESLEDLLGELTFGFGRLPQPVHRLDRDTSGCLLLARNPKAHKRFGQAFEAGTVVKRYLAILDGEPGEDGGTIDLPLIKISSEAEGQLVEHVLEALRAVARAIYRQPRGLVDHDRFAVDKEYAVLKHVPPMPLRGP